MYAHHKEIGPNMASYLLSVADAECISDIPLEDINSFLDGLDKQEE